jgi:L-fucono-1,5-lactonase
MRLDAHQHFWKFDVTEYPWIKTDWPIRRNFLPPDLHPILDKSGFGGSIAVQARQTLAETHWLLDLAERYPFIKGVVGWVNLRSKRVDKELAQFAHSSKFVGVRHVVQDEPDDRFMLQPDFMRGIGRLAEFNLTYDILIFPRQLPAAIELAKRFPSQPFVLDHMAKPNIKAGELSPWREQIVELGKCPNVMCKVSGMLTETNWNVWKKEDFEPYLDVVFEAFGLSRLMFGSDWPVCLLSGTYEDAFGVVANGLSAITEPETKPVFGANAERFYLKRQNNP